MTIVVYGADRAGEREFLASFELIDGTVRASYATEMDRLQFEREGIYATETGKVFPSDGEPFMRALRTYFKNSSRTWIEEP